MRVSREQAEKNRAHVVEVAGTEFRRHGFDGIGVADLMKAAGLTHGGFYGQFDSKDALAAEALSKVFVDTAARMRECALGTENPIATMATVYLSANHREAVGTGCGVAALAQDAARGSEALRRAFQDGIEVYLDLIVELGGVTRERAMAIYATMVGALTLSRTVPDKAMADEILKAAVASVSAK